MAEDQRKHENDQTQNLLHPATRNEISAQKAKITEPIQAVRLIRTVAVYRYLKLYSLYL